jgi:hypothetical protein
VPALALETVDRVIRGETKLHRRLRREFVFSIVVVSFVVIYRTLSGSPGNAEPPDAAQHEHLWFGPAIPGNAVKGPKIGAFPIPGIRYFPDKGP